MSDTTKTEMLERVKRGSAYILGHSRSVKADGKPVGANWSSNHQSNCQVWTRSRTFEDKDSVPDYLDPPYAEIPEVCAEGTLRCTPIELEAIICQNDLESRLKWDAKCENFKILEVLEGDTDESGIGKDSLTVYWLKTKPKMMGLIASREYYFSRKIDHLEDGTIIVSGDSINYKAKEESVGGVQGWAMDSGYCITPNEDGSCIVTYCATTTLMGSVPHNLVIKVLPGTCMRTFEGWNGIIEEKK